MILDIQPGIENEITQLVGENDIASSFGSEHMPVLATSKIVAFMEYVALSSVQDLMPKGHSTVGSEINLKHFKPVLAGETISCLSRLIKVDGRRLYFEIYLRNAGEEVARASHLRMVINNKAFKRLIGI